MTINGINNFYVSTWSGKEEDKPVKEGFIELLNRSGEKRAVLIFFRLEYSYTAPDSYLGKIVAKADEIAVPIFAVTMGDPKGVENFKQVIVKNLKADHIKPTKTVQFCAVDPRNGVPDYQPWGSRNRGFFNRAWMSVEYIAGSWVPQSFAQDADNEREDIKNAKLPLPDEIVSTTIDLTQMKSKL